MPNTLLRLAAAVILLATADGALSADEPAEKPRAGFVEIAARGRVRFENGAGGDRVPEHFRLDPHEFEFRARPFRTGKYFRLMAVT